MEASKSDHAPEFAVPHDLTLPAEDGYPLGARLWAQTRNQSPGAVALVNPGAGIALGYYERFDRFLAAQGV